MSDADWVRLEWAQTLNALLIKVEAENTRLRSVLADTVKNQDHLVAVMANTAGNNHDEARAILADLRARAGLNGEAQRWQCHCGAWNTGRDLGAKCTTCREDGEGGKKWGRPFERGPVLPNRTGPWDDFELGCAETRASVVEWLRAHGRGLFAEDTWERIADLVEAGDDLRTDGEGGK